MNAKIADDQAALINGMTFPSSPPTPSTLSKIPLSATPIVYPTPLSPPRRSIPQSPRAAQHIQRQQRPDTPPSISRALTGANKPNVDSSNRYLRSISPSPSPASSRISPQSLNQSQLPRVPVVTTEWLKRKPSTGRLRHNASLSVDNVPVPPSHPMSSTVTSPRPVQNEEKPKALDESPQIEQRTTSSNRNRIVSHSSSTNSDIDGVSSSDGEIGFSSPYRILHGTTPSKSTTRPSGNGPDRGYEVKITCLDDRADNEEMKWQVTIRQRSSKNSLHHPTSPLQLSTATSLAQAPATASSINLSLSLDKPTGKLVFISFPMDIHATPTTRRRRGSHSQPPTLSQTYTTSPKNMSAPNYRPVTPPPIPRTMGATTSRPTTPTSSVRKKPPPAWSSPIAPEDGAGSA